MVDVSTFPPNSAIAYKYFLICEVAYFHLYKLCINEIINKTQKE